ncbi:hypothetical protein [Quadrisphaera sp. KR29]|uniref:hypothetical protein n=1 Tax=Quadrisphaera sp. KR29 TaxID=3461391 RepID=UPI004044C12B
MRPEPGDLFFSRGRGLQGWVIRRASRSTVAHCGLLVRELEPGTWRTHEAFGGDGPYGGGSGLRERVRPLDGEPLVLVRPWRTPAERDLGLLRSHQLLDQGYDWGEITRIAGHLLHLPPLQRLGASLSRPDRLICSNHCAAVLLAGRPDVVLPHPPDQVWPAPLLEALTPLSRVGAP